MTKKIFNFVEGRRRTSDCFKYTVTEDEPHNQKCTPIEQKQNARAESCLVQWLRDAFLPQGYPSSVSADYLQYQLWDTFQAYCSSVAGSVSLHATLGSLGVGQEGSTALAATITWLTNTGAGMVAAIAFTYCKGTQLDSNNKQWRLFADVTNDFVHILKLATPLLPVSPILPLTGAAMMSALVGVAGGATRTALTAHQARCNNLADVSAKDGSQETLVNLAALLTSLLVLPLITHSLLITWSVFLCLLTVHLFCNYKAVRAIVAPSLNRPRLLLIFEEFMASRTVTDITNVNKSEPLLKGPAFRGDYLSPSWTLELGCPMSRAVQHCLPLRELPRTQHNFMLLVEPSNQRIFVVLLEAASDRDILLASWAAFVYACQPPLPRVPAADGVNYRADETDRVIEKATESFPLLLQKMQKNGWDVDQIYLNVGEWRLITT